jgi:hypothetical protein
LRDTLGSTKVIVRHLQVGEWIALKEEQELQGGLGREGKGGREGGRVCGERGRVGREGGRVEREGEWGGRGVKERGGGMREGGRDEG